MKLGVPMAEESWQKAAWDTVESTIVTVIFWPVTIYVAAIPLNLSADEVGGYPQFIILIGIALAGVGFSILLTVFSLWAIHDAISTYRAQVGRVQGRPITDQELAIELQSSWWEKHHLELAFAGLVASFVVGSLCEQFLGMTDAAIQAGVATTFILLIGTVALDRLGQFFAGATIVAAIVSAPIAGLFL